MSDKSDLLDWLDAKTAEMEKAQATRKLIQQEQRRMTKRATPALSSTEPPRKGPTVLTLDQWRTLLTSGKSRFSISKETGCNDRTIRNRAQALNIPVPPSRCLPQSTL